MDGPNGIGVFLPCLDLLKDIIPITVPIIEAKNRVNRVGTQPKTKPITKNNLISPRPCRLWTQLQ